MSNPLQDLRFAFRQMRRSPGFAVTAVLTLALGIAANIIVFGVLQAIILQPLDMPHSDRVMQLQPTNIRFPVFSYPEIRDMRDDNTVFDAVAAEVTQNFGIEVNGNTDPIWGLEVSGQYFEVLAIKPALGRLLQRSDDDHPEASNAAVLSWPTWKTEFHGDPNIVGKIVRLNKHPYTIVGVTEEDFHGTEAFLDPGIFVPMQNEASLEGVNWLDQRHDKNLFALVRIKDGVSMKQVQAEMDTVAARIRKQYPVEEEKLGFRLGRPGLLGDYLGGPARAFLAGVMGLGGIVLLAACANLGSLFAARTADRAREIAIRMAVGSSRWRILRQVFVEALAISIMGGLCACGLAWAALTGLAQWHPPSDYPIHFHVMPQPSLIAIGLLISVFAAIVCGVMPLQQIFRADPNDTIKSGGTQSAAGRRWALRDVLLAAEIALCCVTVTAAFVSLRGLNRALTMDLGFNPRGVVLTRFDLSQAAYSPEAADRFQRLLLEKVAQLPGVESAGYANTTPMANPSTTDIFDQKTTEFKTSTRAFSPFIYDVAPGFFAAAETPLLTGRDVSYSDTANTPLVAVVNQQFVRSLFHTGHADDAVGRYFRNKNGKLVQIVGIVRNGKYFFLSEDQGEALFYPISQTGDSGIDLIVRSRTNTDNTGDLSAAVRKVIHDMDSSVPLHASESWTSSMSLIFFPTEVATAALGLFGAFGLLLSIAGTFGLASYTVSKRLRELSIRVALGAQARQILSAALGRMLVLLAMGSAIGLAVGVMASRLLSAVVYQASAQDPVILAAVAITMMLTGSLSVAGPVRKTLKIDPANVLREQ